MNAPTAPIGDDDGMPAEINFAGGVRGKFYKPNLRLIPPVRLEPQVQDTLLDWVAAKGVDYNTFVNDLPQEEY